MATDVSKELNSIIECCICTEIFTDPRMLPCIHTFCVKCLTETGLRAKKGPGDKMSCPLCRTEFTIPTDGFRGLLKNFFVDKLVDVVQLSSKQNVCDSNSGNCSSVKWYCDECKQKLCDECSELHRKICTQGCHSLVPFDNQRETMKSLDFSNVAFCDQHEGEELKIFCSDCQRGLCAICFLENHQSHKWSQVKEVAKKFRTQIASNAVMLSGCVPEAQSKIEQLDKDNVEFLETVRQVESEVHKKQLEVKALLDKIMHEDTRSLILTLTSFARAKSKRTEIEKEDVDRHLTKLNSYINFCKDIAAKGSDVDICRAVNDLNSRAKELKDLHGTVIQQNFDAFHLCFEKRKSEDFLKAFHGNMLGKIEVPDQDNAGSQHQQKSLVVDNLRNPQVTTPGITLNLLNMKSEYAQKVTQRISLGDRADNSISKENKSALQPLLRNRLKNLLATAPAASLLNKQGNIEENTNKEKSQGKVQDKAIEKSQEKVQENILEKRTQEQAQERTHGLIPITKQLPVEKEDTQEPPLAAEPLQMEQKKSKEPVPTVRQSEEKTEKTHAPIPSAARSEKNENIEYLRRTIYSSLTAHQEMANSQHQQQSVMFNQQNPQVIMSGMQYMPYMVRQGTMMSTQPPPTPQQSAAIRQTMMMPPRFSSPMPPYQQQHPQQQQQQQQQQQTGFVQQEQQHYSMLPPDSNYHLAAAASQMHPTYYQAMQVQQPVPQRSDGSMPGNAPPPQVFANGGQMQQPNAQQWQMYQQPPSMQRYSPMVSLRLEQPMPMQSMMPPSMLQPGIPQEMPTKVVARPHMHVGDSAQRPQFMPPRQQRSDIVYYDPLKPGNDVDDKASQAAKPKPKTILAIIDPSTGQKVLETLEMTSRQTSNEALKIKSEFAHKVIQRISLGDKAPNFNLENSTPTQPVHGARPKNRLATAKTDSLCESQPLETKPVEGQANVSTASAEQTSVNCTDKN